MRKAAIGIGSNSLRMLIADVNGQNLEKKERYREGLRVFAALDDEGNISSAMLAEACEKVSFFHDEALKQGVQKVHLFATSATRDARNQEAFSKALQDRTGLQMHICDGNLEAILSFVGATLGQSAGMIDIGGGSTEFAIGKGYDLTYANSLQMGAVRMFRAHDIHSMDDVPVVASMCDQLLKSENIAGQQNKTSQWFGVGGTFTTAAAFVQKIPLSQRSMIDGFALTRSDVYKAIQTLAPMTMQERVTLPYLQPQRADIVVHGLVILHCSMLSLNIDRIIVSESGNLEGYLKWIQNATA